MSLEKNDRSRKVDQLELDLDSLNLDMVSERYRVHLTELQVWFKMTEEALKVDPAYDQSNGPISGPQKSTINK